MAGKPKRKSFDVDLVRGAARGRWADIAQSVFKLDPESIEGDHGPCPKCGGCDRWRVYNDFRETGGAICGQCNRQMADGFALGQWILGQSFQSVLAQVAEHLGVEPESPANGKPRRSKSADPAEHLEFQPWNDLLAATWCALYKPGITPAAMVTAGCKLARYRGQHSVFALPTWGPKLTAAPPVGWTIYNVSGGKLPKFVKGLNGKPGKVESVKVKVTHGSHPGFIGPVDQLAAAATIWKTEGPTDLLALLSLELPPSHTAITNANGAGERPQPWMLELFAGKLARVIHDADQPGDAGAAGYDGPDGRRRPGWAELIALRAADCRHVRLPYPIAESHGKDLRDWVTEGHDYRELEEMAERCFPAPAPPADVASAAATVQAAPAAAGQPHFAAYPAIPGQSANESDDDPHRLARVNLERYATHSAGATLRYWREEFYTWKGSRGCYRKIAIEELRAKINRSIKLEFDRINIEQQLEQHRETTPITMKVGKSLVTNVLDATKSLTVVPSSVEMPAWLDGELRERRNYIAMSNGVLDLSRLLENRDSDQLPDVLLQHSPAWFSTIRLPYAFEPPSPGQSKCPTWEKFLERNLELDPERIKLLQEWAGYLLLPDTSQQKFLVLEGEGANGKSVYCAAITAMLGTENCSHIPIEQFGDRFAKTQTIGKLANICADVGEVDKPAEGYLKSFTSGDVMFFDRKGVPGIDCAPTARLMLACNNRPRFSDRSSGIWRRMMIVPFNVQIPITERVLGMDKVDWWQRSGELPGIFLWAVAGLHRLIQQHRFTESAACAEALDDYRTESNPARAFLQECIEMSPQRGIKTSTLYHFYCRWMEAHGNRPLGERLFGGEVKRVFQGTDRRRGGDRRNRYWYIAGVDFASDTICNEATESLDVFSRSVQEGLEF